MKKHWLLTTLLAIALCVICFTLFPTEAKATTEGYLTYEIVGGEAIITDCDDSISGEIIIPDTLGGYPVTAIGNEAFEDCESLTSVTIPDGVTSIGDSAFYDCSSLTSVTIPESVTSIGEWAFSHCSSLTSVTIGSGVTSIGEWAFSHCSSLTSVTIPESVTSIGEWAFSYCSSLTSITIPDSVASIGMYAFAYCESLTSVTIGSGVTSIGSGAFFSCYNLTSITIPDRVTRIGIYAFYGCSSLTDITIPAGVTDIGFSTFEGCSSLTDITIPAGVTSIGSYAFDGCSSLKTVYYRGDETGKSNIGISSYNDCLTSTQWYYNACIGTENHSYTDNCDTTCNICQATRTPPHSYTNACDTTCNECSATRSNTHTYDNAFDTKCNECGYVRIVYCITFDANGGEGAPNKQAAFPSIQVTLSSSTPTRAGFKFMGWGTKESCGKQYAPGEQITVDKDITLYALWFGGCSACSGSGTITTTSECSCGDGKITESTRYCTKCSRMNCVVEHVTGSGRYMLCNNCGGINTAGYSSSTYEHSVCNGTGILQNKKACTECEGSGIKESQTAGPIISNFTDTVVTLYPKAGYEYSMDGVTWQTSNVFENLSPATRYSFYWRIGATKDAPFGLPSESTSVTTDKSKQTQTPPAPTVQSFTSSSITLTPVAGCEYSKNGTTWQTSNVFSGLSCATEYTFYQRYKESATIYAGKSSTAISAKTDKGTQSKPSAPSLSSKTYNSVTLHARSGYEYSRDGINWQSSNVFTGLNAETNYLFCQRKAETATYYASEASATLAVRTAEAPACIADPTLHIYTNACDTTCNICGATRVTQHKYDSSNKCACGAQKMGVLTQPKTAKVKAGSTAKFTVKASGNGLKYQWQSSSNGKTWKNCSSSKATSATFTFTSKTSHSSNHYRCKITDSMGNVVYTDAVRLYVLGVTTQPKTQKVEAGEKVKFTVTATGAGKTYQWQYSTNGKTWKNCSSSSAKKATFTFTSKISHSGNYYRCKVTDSAGNVVYTSAVKLYVLGITQQPVRKTVTKGKTVKFEVEATGASKVYQWQVSTDGGKTWKNCSSSSAKKAAFTFTAKTSHNGNYYRCRVKDSGGNTIYTNKVKLTVK